MYTPQSFEVKQRPAQPLWSQYAFAVAVSGVMWLASAWLSEALGGVFPPLAAGFLAVTGTALVSGTGPTLLATAISVAIAVISLRHDQNETTVTIVARLGVFLFLSGFTCYWSAVVRRAKDQLAAALASHHTLLESSGEGIWLLSTTGQITYANPRIAELLGCTTSHLLTCLGEDFFFPADLSVERIRFQNRRAGHKDQFDRRLRRADGSELWVLTCSSPVLDDNGTFQGVLSMMTDITERKRAESALRRSEEKFRGLFENVFEGVYQSTPEGRIVAANSTLLRMLGGISERELNEVDIANDLYIDPKVRQHLLERLEHEGSLRNAEYQLRRIDGNIITVLENARSVRDEDGRILYYEGTLTDITDRRRIETELHEAQKAEALGRLASGIAHDFSNILTVISGYTRLLLDELTATHPARASAENLAAAAASGDDLTSQLLAFSKQGGQGVGQVDLNVAVRLGAEALPAALGPGCRIAWELSVTPLIVTVSASQIEQILVSAAQRFRTVLPPRSAIELRTEAVRVSPGEDGFPPDTKPGFYARLGIGCREGCRAAEDSLEPVALNSVVAHLGGFARLDDSAASGLCLSVFLPATEIGGGVVETAAAALRNRILLINGEPLVRELSRDLLERQGYRVILAETAAEAQRMAAGGEGFDLLITDLPSDRGVRASLRGLKKALPDLKVLFISGYSEAEQDSISPDLADALLRKPFSAESLARTIRQMLD